MSSRICVKNLTKNTTEKDLKDLFGARGEITDVKIVKTATGKSRQFGFLGFRTHNQAQDCQEYFNNTFLKSARITVEMAMKIGDPSLSGKGSRQQKDKCAVSSLTVTAAGPPKAGKKKGVVATTHEPESTKSEFMSVMKSRGQGQFWANDAALPPTAYSKRSDNRGSDHEGESGSVGVDSDSDVSSDSDETPDMDMRAGSRAAIGQTVSDMSYLKSKVKRLVEDSSDSECEVGSDNDYDDHVDVDTRHGEGGDEASIGSPAKPAMVSENAIGNVDDPGTDESRLFVRNLPFSCSEDELSDLFKSFGPLTQVHIPLADTGDGRGKGFAFVQFMIPEHAINAKRELDGTSFQGRLLHVIDAKKAIEPQTDAADMAAAAKARKMTSYQLKKEEERKKSAAVKEGWNASHLRSDTVIEATADKYALLSNEFIKYLSMYLYIVVCVFRYGVSRADIMDTSKVSGGELAVRLAISETQILQENREYFKAHGVDMAALESATSSNKTMKRSNTTILVKNLPYDLIDSELEDMFSKYSN